MRRHSALHAMGIAAERQGCGSKDRKAPAHYAVATGVISVLPMLTHAAIERPAHFMIGIS